MNPHDILDGLERRAELGGGEAPDLHDKRDLALKKLGAMADISTSKDNNGRVTVTLAGHVAIVNGESVNELRTMRTPADSQTGKKEDLLDIYVDSPTPQKLTQILKTGRLGALLEVRDHDVGSARDQINQVAHLITTEVNNLHRQGFGLDGGTGRDFFEESGDPSRAAASFKLSDHIMNNLGAIAAAKEPNSEIGRAHV